MRARNGGSGFYPVTANPGCLLQMRAGANIHKTGQEVMHVIEYADRADFPSR